MIAAAPSRPALRYHGGKWLLAPWIIAHLPAHRHYVEPFAGAASVLLRKPRAHAEVYNDLNGELVNVFRVLRDPRAAARLRRALVLTPFARAEFEASYAPAATPVERARRTIVRSFMGYGSNSVDAKAGRTGFRGRSDRSNTTPAHDWAHWPAQVPAFAERLAAVVIEQRPALDVIRDYDRPETLHYVDPPYVHSTRRVGKSPDPKGFYAHELTDDDHRALAAALRACTGMVVLSGYPSALYDRELFADWRRVERAAMADGAHARTEVLWLNPAAAARLPTQLSLASA